MASKQVLVCPGANLLSLLPHTSDPPATQLRAMGPVRVLCRAPGDDACTGSWPAALAPLEVDVSRLMAAMALLMLEPFHQAQGQEQQQDLLVRPASLPGRL